LGKSPANSDISYTVRGIIMKKKSTLLVATVIAFFVFTVGALLAVGTIQELSLLRNHLKDCVPQDFFLKEENRCWQLILNFLMLAIGGSLLSFSAIYRGIYFRHRLYDKLSAMIGLTVTFVLNFFVEFRSIWVIFTYLTVIVTFDCVFIFTKEEYDRFIASRKAKRVE
jgi:hypothetical protein